MRAQAEIKSVEYDIDSSKLRSQPDLELLINFLEEGSHKNMVIEYATGAECTRRRACLNAWLSKSKYAHSYYTKVRKEKLYVLKEGENI